ncbi:MAG: hypothetical protein HN350_09065 [Phycisphaerales bacterium]|nr:hypothetical protein [Phycisphaerales bacterium]
MKYWTVTGCLVVCGIAAMACGDVKVVCVDDNACGFATFQSHNQKLVSNANGIFMTYLKEDNEKDPVKPNVWRLMRSIDGGKTFTVAYEGRNGCRAPCIETDRAGNLYLAHPDYGTKAKRKREFHFYRFSAAGKYKTPGISIFPDVGCASKYAMAHDAKHKRFYIATQYGQLLTVGENGKLLSKRSVLNARGPKGCTQYPLLQVDRTGKLHHAWTTVQRGKPVYWDIHYMLSPDGAAWFNLKRKKLKTPIVPDNTGPTLRVSLDDEFEPNTWLSNFMARDGKVHFIYHARTKPSRQHYMRYDIASGRRDIHLQSRFKGETITLAGVSGFFASESARPQSTLYCVIQQRGHIAALASNDNGKTWRDHAKSKTAYRPYALGGAREITADGHIIGSFTQGEKVYFLRISAEQESPAKALLKTRDPFYKQHRISGGVLILGSEKVSKYAMNEVAHLVKNMLANRPDVLEHLAKNNNYIGIQAYCEMTSDLPEQSGLDVWWDYRARGLCGALVTCGEENVLMYPGDPWVGESIFVHEFAHQIMHTLLQIDKGYKARLSELCLAAQKSKRFRGYGLNDSPNAPLEFWAEGVQAYFNCNGAIRPEAAGSNPSLEALDAKGNHLCHIRTRAQLKKHLPGLAALIDKSFGRNKWTYTPVAQRLDQPHLRGYDPVKAPTFRWPKEVIEGFKRIEAERKAAKAR